METADNFITASGKKLTKDYHSFGPTMRDVFILHYVLDGAGYLEFAGKRIKIEKGHFFLLRPFIFYKYYSDTKNPWTYLWVNFRGDGYETILNLIDFGNDGCQSQYLDPKEVTPLLDKLIEKYDFHKKSNYCEGLLYSVLGLLADNFPNMQSNINLERFSECCSLIDVNYSSPDFNIETICKELNISSPTLFRTFKYFSGISPKKYLNLYRIAKAKKLLDNGMSVKSVALSCGYNEPLYFSRAFSKAIGVSPKKYKEISHAIDTNMETAIYTASLQNNN